MSILDTKCARDFARMCEDGWLQGWHESNGGNLTYRMTDGDVRQCERWLGGDIAWNPMAPGAENLAGECFMVTRAGSFMRNVPLDPERNTGIVRISGDGRAWGVAWGLAGGRPTSELLSHLLIHGVRKEVTNGADRVLYHAHPPALIALTFLLPLDDKAITRALWGCISECAMVCPGGVGVVEWLPPGGRRLALATSAVMRRRDAAVWVHHGLLCSGADFDMAFGLMHTIEKAADIYTRARACGAGFEQSMSDENIRELARECGININEEFLG